jgi:hypothetical protein
VLFSRLIVVAAVVAGPVIGPASAGIMVERESEAIRLSAQDAPLTELLAALSDHFKVTYVLAPEQQRLITGSYSGNLRQVLGRILEGYDYITQGSGDYIEINVIGRSGMIAQPTSSIPRTPPGAAIPDPPAFLIPGPNGHREASLR